MRLLLVDDEEELVATLAERLTMRGLEADWATCAEDALDRLARGRYDLALLDVKMPRMSGFELKKAIQAQAPHMKFIFITGHGSEADFRQGTAEAGADYYLTKPVALDVLLRKVQEVMGA
jgi:DNA-binding response OmpR family regulator